ncbi:MAG TPA: methylmalonyl Co-A mutase-associated GTPase MeaB [Dongiaceae bacterium]|nr:methylmalonyl Co-A mutase-associated GTPase MeaB [Dongiaceae bacterium]
MDVGALADQVKAGDRRALARAITLAESDRPDHRDAAEKLLTLLLSASGRSIRLGISGPPGVGKSTFIESFGLFAIAQGRKVAVLAIDPSSRVSGGSILGDKTRMAELSRHSAAFIRPSPAGLALGGVARRSREALLICEAAGFDLVIVETVGVGQSETTVAELVDMFLLLLLPSGGDDLQGIKRGIMELADLVLVNKADGDLKPAAMRTAADYANALRLMPPLHRAWTTEVLTLSALHGEGLAVVWDKVLDFQQRMQASGELALRRRDQARSWLWQELSDSLLDLLKNKPGMAERLAALEARVVNGKTTPGAAAREVLTQFLG